MYSKLFNVTNKNFIKSLCIRDTRRKLCIAIFIGFEDDAEFEIYFKKDFHILYFKFENVIIFM